MDELLSSFHLDEKLLLKQLISQQVELKAKENNPIFGAVPKLHVRGAGS
jgi:hypothetical protein